MDDREDVTTELEWARRCAHNGHAIDWPMVAAVLVDRLDQIETRAQQIRGGLKPHARPVEIVDYLMGEQP